VRPAVALLGGAGVLLSALLSARARVCVGGGPAVRIIVCVCGGGGYGTGGG
jgi:hypothetical protein